MKTTLIIPKSTPGVPARLRKITLRLETNDSRSHYGFGVLLDPDGEMLDGVRFRFFRDSMGAEIQTDDPAKVRTAMGVPPDESGIVQI
jgi:hypothetical protein